MHAHVFFYTHALAHKKMQTTAFTRLKNLQRTDSHTQVRGQMLLDLLLTDVCTWGNVYKSTDDCQIGAK